MNNNTVKQPQLNSYIYNSSGKKYVTPSDDVLKQALYSPQPINDSQMIRKGSMDEIPSHYIRGINYRSPNLHIFIIYAN